MPYNGSGTYRLPGPALVDGNIVQASEHNNFRDDVATALTDCITRDGQSPATANLPMGNHKLTGLAAGTTNGDSVRYDQLSTKQDTLVSGTNIKTVNSTSLVGSGDVAVQATLVSGTNIKTVNSNSLLGSGNVIITAGVSTVNSTITTSTTITGQDLYVPVAMTAMGKSVTLPDATGVQVGGVKYIIDNTLGTYPAGIRDNTGVLLMAVAAGGVGYIALKDNSTAAGIWSVTGTNLEPGLITIDNTFSSTYASTVLKPFVALDNDKSIHFVNDAAGTSLYAVAVDRVTGAVGTPVLVAVTSTVQTVFKISSTSALCFYAYNSAVVISLSGSTALSIGTPISTGVLTADDFTGAPKVAQLTSTLYLCSYTNGGNTIVVAVSVSGTTVTIGTAANIITANSVVNSTTTYALTATTALVLYQSGASAPYTINAVVISVSGTTCTVGTPVGLSNTSTGSPPSSCLLSSTKALVQTDGGGSQVYVAACTISGTTVSFGTANNIESVTNTGGYTSNSATRYNPHLFPLSTSTALLWYFDSSGVSRAVVLTESGGTVTAGTIVYRSIAHNAATDGLGAIQPQNSTEFIALKCDAAASSTSGQKRYVPHKISGTTITVGQGKGTLSSDLSVGITAANQCSTRLSSGDIVFGVTAYGGAGNSAVPVIRTNGDSVNYRGSIACPALVSSGFPVQGNGSNRVVLLGATTILSSTIGTATYQLRLLNVEIAK